MSLPLFGLIMVISLAWGGWSLVANASNLKDPLVRGFLVNICTAIAFIPFLRGRISWDMAFSNGGIILLVAGVVNFLGHLLFPRLQTITGNQISVYMVMILALCCVVSAIGGPLFFKDAVTLPKILFTLLIVIGVIGLGFS